MLLKVGDRDKSEKNEHQHCWWGSWWHFLEFGRSFAIPIGSNVNMIRHWECCSFSGKQSNWNLCHSTLLKPSCNECKRIYTEHHDRQSCICLSAQRKRHINNSQISFSFRFVSFMQLSYSSINGRNEMRHNFNDLFVVWLQCQKKILQSNFTVRCSKQTMLLCDVYWIEFDSLDSSSVWKPYETSAFFSHFLNMLYYIYDAFQSIKIVQTCLHSYDTHRISMLWWISPMCILPDRESERERDFIIIKIFSTICFFALDISRSITAVGFFFFWYFNRPHFENVFVPSLHFPSLSVGLPWACHCHRNWSFFVHVMYV